MKRRNNLQLYIMFTSGIIIGIFCGTLFGMTFMTTSLARVVGAVHIDALNIDLNETALTQAIYKEMGFQEPIINGSMIKYYNCGGVPVNASDELIGACRDLWAERNLSYAENLKH